MDIKLTKAKFEDLDTILQMQKEAFSELYAKYQDTETSPATEKYENILFRFNQPETTYYFITADNVKVGVIRIVDCKDGDQGSGAHSRQAELEARHDLAGKRQLLSV